MQFDLGLTTSYQKRIGTSYTGLPRAESVFDNTKYLHSSAIKIRRQTIRFSHSLFREVLSHPPRPKANSRHQTAQPNFDENDEEKTMSRLDVRALSGHVCTMQ